MGVVEKELGSTASSNDVVDVDVGTQKVLELFANLDAAGKKDVAAFITANSNLAQDAASKLAASSSNVVVNTLGSSETLGQAGAAILAVRGVKRAFRGAPSTSVKLFQTPDEGDDQDVVDPDQEAAAAAAAAPSEDGGPTEVVETFAQGIFGKIASGVSGFFDKLFAPIIAETKELQAEQDAEVEAGATPDELALIPAAAQERFLAWEEKMVNYCQGHTYTVTLAILCFLFFYYFIYQWAWKKPISFAIFAIIYATWAYNRVNVQGIQTSAELEDMLKKRFLLAFEESRVWVGESVKTLYAWFFFFLPFLHDLWLMIAPYLYLYGSALKRWYIALPVTQQYIADVMGLVFLVALWQLCRFRSHVQRMWSDQNYRNNVYYAF